MSYKSIPAVCLRILLIVKAPTPSDGPHYVSMVSPKGYFLLCINFVLDLECTYFICRWFWLLLYAAITIPFAPFVVQPIKFFR